MLAGSDTRSRVKATPSARASRGAKAALAVLASAAAMRRWVMEGFFSGFSLVRYLSNR